jgi:glycosyltransferase involved in cell wall biosynthesis
MVVEAKNECFAISVMIFTLNEELNIQYCLDSVSWCNDIIVVDSGSRDGTRQICEKAGARVFENPFEGFGSQRNWALKNTKPRHEWVLILDADERVTEKLGSEIRNKLHAVDADVGAFRIRRRFYMWGRWLRRSSLYPTWVVRLVRVNRVKFVDRGHAETQIVKGAILELEEDLLDENHKGLESWFERQNRYSTRDAQYELDISNKSGWWKDLWTTDPLERRAALKVVSAGMPFRPLIYFVYSYLLRGGFLDGAPGLWFCLMRANYQFMVSAKKREMRLKMNKF